MRQSTCWDCLQQWQPLWAEEVWRGCEGTLYCLACKRRQHTKGGTRATRVAVEPEVLLRCCLHTLCCVSASSRCANPDMSAGRDVLCLSSVVGGSPLWQHLVAAYAQRVHRNGRQRAWWRFLDSITKEGCCINGQHAECEAVLGSHIVALGSHNVGLKSGHKARQRSTSMSLSASAELQPLDCLLFGQQRQEGSSLGRCFT